MATTGFHAMGFTVVGIEESPHRAMPVQWNLAGHKQSFFGDLYTLGKDSLRLYIESKVVTTRWFDEAERKKTQVSTWDGAM